MRYKILYQSDVAQGIAEDFKIKNKILNNQSFFLAFRAQEVIGHLIYERRAEFLLLKDLKMEKQYIGRGMVAGMLLNMENRAHELGGLCLQVEQKLYKKYKSYFIGRKFIMIE